MPDPPPSAAEQARQRLREKLAASQARFEEHPDDETREEYQQALRALSNVPSRKRLLDDKE